jgi:hypothetical protein
MREMPTASMDNAHRSNQDSRPSRANEFYRKFVNRFDDSTQRHGTADAVFVVDSREDTVFVRIGSLLKSRPRPTVAKAFV